MLLRFQIFCRAVYSSLVFNLKTSMCSKYHQYFLCLEMGKPRQTHRVHYASQLISSRSRLKAPQTPSTAFYHEINKHAFGEESGGYRDRRER